MFEKKIKKKLGEIRFQFLTAIVGLKIIPSPFLVTGVRMGMWLINGCEEKCNGRLLGKALFFPKIVL